jgi:hypothetical protein
MSEIKRILLLDIDGVLLQPGGYRKAVKATINYFTRQAGLPDLSPEEEILALFESKGITNEWDIVPICLATILETILESYPEIILPVEWALAAANINSQKATITSLEYRKKILEISRFLKTGKSPSKVIFEAGLNRLEGAPFPLISKQPLFITLFNDNKNVEGSITTRVFQNFVLGSDLFQEIYHLDPLIITPSYLNQFDQPNLSERNCHEILLLSKAGIISPVAYTARPSLPPGTTITSEAGYSPEAELALKLVGMEDIPLIAYGRLMFAAQLFQVSTDLLIKPSPFQSLAAISVAVMSKKDEEKALIFAGNICEASGLFPNRNERTPERKYFDPGVSDFLLKLRAYRLVIDIIEDSPIGLTAAKHACQILSGFNVSAEIHGWGVAQDRSKKTALEEMGAEVYSSTDEVISIVLKDLSPS